jgi:protein-S-isoprenylcysteine O-methyltransferase Ste14
VSRPSPLLRTLAFTLVVPATVAGALPALLLVVEPGDWRFATTGAVRALGWGVAVAGVVLYGWCAWRFATTGRGTPAPHDPPRRLVTAGPYAISRNPMYVAVLAVVSGAVLVTGSPTLAGYLAILAIGFHRRVIRYEEPTLNRTFGEAYQRYCARVPRWLGRSRG